MSRRKQNRDIQKFIRKFFKQIWQLAVALTKAMFQWLLRLMLVTRQPQRRNARTSGFVLPTVSLLLVVVALVIGAILFRTGSRTNQVISERDQQVIYNAATPAIERAKAKLEYLFKRDDRLPNTVPSEDVLMSMLLNVNNSQVNIQALPDNPYKFPDETPLDINGGGEDAAWSYPIDADGDPQTGLQGKETTVAYSIVFRAREPGNPDNSFDPRKSFSEKQKAEKLIVRNGPITIQESVNPKCKRLNSAPESGWDLVSQASLRKTFQVSAVVVSNKNANRTLTTLEFQQDRELARANKWGAWFRYDMHIHPGPKFQWNGAMHTEGSLYLGGNNDESVKGFLISAQASCLYDPESSSEVSIGRVKDDAGNITFAGHVFNGTISGNSFGKATYHIHQRPEPITQNSNNNNVEITPTNDSVGSGTAEQIALDAVELFTKDKSKAFGGGNNVDRADANSEWISRERLKANRRLIAKTEQPPYVDDTYRADDRLGPKPKYDLEGNNNDVELGNNGWISGIPIATAGGLSADQRKQLSNNTAPPNDKDLNTLGLDGYWERRARAEGLRIIVGPRLELGNTYGWGGNRDLNADGDTTDFNEPWDPLYPPDSATPLTHEAQQRRTWRDNLAAVQATTVYHYTQNTGDVPIACLSTTAHPGTQATIALSTNFNNANGQLSTNFFTGKGTNGWEYKVPDLGDGNVQKAIKNLANFAGEKEGAFPPKQESGKVHPDPYLAMWGNFSNLRRAIDEPATNPVTGAESIADLSYKYSAACTMGILAKNIDDIRQYTNTNSPDYTVLDTALKSIPTGTTLPSNATLENYIAAIPAGSLPPTQVEKLRISSLWQQIERDREWGFAKIPEATLDSTDYTYTIQHNSSATGGSGSYEWLGVTYDANVGTETATQKKTLKLRCNYRQPAPTGNNFFGFGNPTNATEEQRFIRLAVSLCSSSSLAQPKFPSLYYLFPKAAHGRDNPNSPDDNNELYITKTSGIPGQFDTLDPAQLAGTVQLKNWGDWQTPTNGSAGSRPNPNKITLPGGGDGYVSFLDSVMFDGRELMPVRVLDIDLQLLKDKDIGSDKWFPKSGVVYAFREDAVREDAIARPAGGNPYADATNTSDPKDPALATTGISPKPVDFYPDPGRRPHGFRLRNGEDLRREQSNPRGITFVSDNPVAIQGNFNLHTHEEFNQRLFDPNSNANAEFGVADFYTNRTDLNENFATLAGDNWRPAEILSDAIAILSKDFKDGSLDEGIRGIAGNSYGSMNAPRNNASWVREDGSASNGTPLTDPNANIPIRIDRNGNLSACGGNSLTVCPSNPPVTDYLKLDNSDLNRRVDNLNPPNRTQVNAILVSGVVPARNGQSNGGLHNFPRLLEKWRETRLGIAGSFIQLNFSTYATGPYDQDAWEPGTATKVGGGTGNELTFYYSPPNRAWGYDVGLQYAAAGPLSKRFITSETPRSEFYEEPKANDPYICNLRRAIAGREGTENPSQVSQECQP